MKDGSVINMDPDVMGGTPVFRGTRVPIQHFIEHLKYEGGIDNFFDDFPTVSREQVIRLIDELDGLREKILVTA
uniref:Uncharacterized conserved protein, DUF433 family n=1 Tax=Candidatus Kentrum sp. SD TaxID=2126332 RepID=A0A451BJ35_9GAMM|nr:MAG: Uncharacterized conserved protein, DUF433 family [Candidatus Kentron sp. SD]VFK41167.1 MAG: Uncharacterized conserved protein, DUF433 family [Candidatus Kentron sp. SD]VFK78279.1 MAG: Uncharacterized conserved protein, DUF433 family [Candidatus Kentron sp. SD]